MEGLDREIELEDSGDRDSAPEFVEVNVVWEDVASGSNVGIEEDTGLDGEATRVGEAILDDEVPVKNPAPSAWTLACGKTLFCVVGSGDGVEVVGDEVLDGEGM